MDLALALRRSGGWVDPGILFEAIDDLVAERDRLCRALGMAVEARQAAVRRAEVAEEGARLAADAVSAVLWDLYDLAVLDGWTAAELAPVRAALQGSVATRVDDSDEPQHASPSTRAPQPPVPASGRATTAPRAVTVPTDTAIADDWGYDCDDGDAGTDSATATPSQSSNEQPAEITTETATTATAPKAPGKKEPATTPTRARSTTRGEPPDGVRTPEQRGWPRSGRGYAGVEEDVLDALRVRPMTSLGLTAFVRRDYTTVCEKAAKLGREGVLRKDGPKAPWRLADGSPEPDPEDP